MSQSINEQAHQVDVAIKDAIGNPGDFLNKIGRAMVMQETVVRRRDNLAYVAYDPDDTGEVAARYRDQADSARRKLYALQLLHGAAKLVGDFVD